MYADTKSSLKSVLDWPDGSDEADWDHQIETGERCRFAMGRLARPIYSIARMGCHTLGPEPNPDAGRLNKAIPHIRAMLTAMRNRNRVAAVEHARAAMAVM